MSPLSRKWQAIVDQASSAAVLKCLAGILVGFPTDRWLSATNRYKVNPITQISSDLQGGGVLGNDMTSYVAASIVPHCVDGWSYLGRALDCHYRGDARSACHMAYYAELRAAMSILASQGVGIFLRHHFVVTSPTTCQEIKGIATHDAVWDVFEHWAGASAAPQLFSKVVAPYGVALGEWLASFGAGPSAPHVATNWLLNWGLDLQRIRTDRDSRNEASYRPSLLTPTPSPSACATLAFGGDLWRVCTPTGGSRLEMLDRALLHHSLRTVFFAVWGKSAVDCPAQFAAAVDAALAGTPFNGVGLDEIRRFLLGPGPSCLIEEAAKHSPRNDPDHHKQIISRATLLLRVASGVCAKALVDAGAQDGDLDSWWKRYGLDVGLWEPQDEPERTADLWGDVEKALNDISSGETSVQNGYSSLATLRRRHIQHISILGECERVALWGLGL